MTRQLSKSLKLLRVSLSLIFIFLTSACGLVRSATESSADLELTQAYQTVAARITENWSESPSPQAATLPPGTMTPTPPSRTPTRTTPGSQQPLVSISPSQDSTCNRVAPGYPAIDVTIDDYTELLPGESFTKIWRLYNAGECTWTRSYAAVYFFGEKMGETVKVSISGDVPPGSSVDVAVDMIAPSQPGEYRSNWMMADDEGGLFGIGPNGDQPFWVHIMVIPPDTATPTMTSPPTQTGTATVLPSPTATMTPTPRVYVSGPAALEPGSSLDLDNLTTNPGSGADLAYQSDGAGTYWLIPEPPALLGFWGVTQPSLADCTTAGKSSAAIALGSLTQGTYLCYQTGEGLTGWLRYDNFDGTNALLDLTILTWAR